MPNEFGGSQFHPAYGGGGGHAPNEVMHNSLLYRIAFDDKGEPVVDEEQVTGKCLVYAGKDLKNLPQVVKRKIQTLKRARSKQVAKS